MSEQVEAQTEEKKEGEAVKRKAKFYLTVQNSQGGGTEFLEFDRLRDVSAHLLRNQNLSPLSLVKGRKYEIGTKTQVVFQ